MLPVGGFRRRCKVGTGHVPGSRTGYLLLRSPWSPLSGADPPAGAAHSISSFGLVKENLTPARRCCGRSSTERASARRCCGDGAIGHCWPYCPCNPPLIALLLRQSNHSTIRPIKSTPWPLAKTHFDSDSWRRGSSRPSALAFSASVQTSPHRHHQHHLHRLPPRARPAGRRPAGPPRRRPPANVPIGVASDPIFPW